MTNPVFERRRVDNVPSLVAFKWSPAVVDEGFIPFPKRLLRCLPRLFEQKGSIGDLQVVLGIVDYARPNLTRNASLDYLAFTTGMTVPIFKDHLQALEQRGWLTVAGSDDAAEFDLSGLMKEIERLSDDGSREKKEDMVKEENNAAGGNAF